jgi:hypothetical protein
LKACDIKFGSCLVLCTVIVHWSHDCVCYVFIQSLALCLSCIYSTHGFVFVVCLFNTCITLCVCRVFIQYIITYGCVSVVSIQHMDLTMCFHLKHAIVPLCFVHHMFSIRCVDSSLWLSVKWCLSM